MSPFAALLYSFLFGLLHGILPDEHTWPITFSYAIGSASGKEGMKAGLYFSAAFTLQRALLSELAYLALAPFLRSEAVNGIVFLVVGIAMAAAGAIVMLRNVEPHLHLLGHHHETAHKMETSGRILGRQHAETARAVTAPPVKWTFIHGFIAGFGFEGFALFTTTIAAPAMPNAWLGFLPGLLFGLGTMLVLVVIGALFGAFLRWARWLSEEEIRQIGIRTSGRTLFYGGLLFGAFGIAVLFGLDHLLPVDAGNLLIAAFMVVIAVPAFIYSWRQVKAARGKTIE